MTKWTYVEYENAMKKLNDDNYQLQSSYLDMQKENAALREQIQVALIQQNAIRSEMVDMSKRLKEAEAINARLVAMLERLEFIVDNECPDCGCPNGSHASDCSLGNLLAEVRKEKKCQSV